MTPIEITKEEKKFFRLFDFSADFLTHFDFYESYLAKVQYDFNQICRKENQSESFTLYGNQMMTPLANMASLLIKMSV